MSDVEIRIDDKIAASIAQKLAQIKTTAKEADTEIDKLKATLSSVSSSRAFQKDAMEAEKLKNTLRQASQVSVSYYGQVSKLNTAIDHQGRSFANSTAQIKNNTGALNQNSSAVKTSTGALQGLISTLAAYAGAQALGTAANTAQQLANQLRTITASQAEYNRLQEQLFVLSNNTRSGIEQTTQLYVNFYKVLQNVGVGQQELFRMIETLNKGFQIGGRSAAEAAGSTRQLIQALQSGVLRGEEFNSIMEQMPIEVLEGLAKAAGVGVEQLRKMAEQGALTRDIIREGLANAATAVDAAFSKTVPTISNAFTILNNEAIRFFMTNSKMADVLSTALLLIAKNLNIVIPLVITFGAAWAAVQLVKIIKDVYSLAAAAVALGVSLAPIIAATVFWVGVIAAVTTALVLLGYTIAKLLGQGDAFEQWIADSITAIQGLGAAVLQQVQGVAGDAVGQLSEEVNKATASFNPGLSGAATQAGSAIESSAADATSALKSTNSAVQQVTASFQRLGSAASKSLSQLRSAASSMSNFVGNSSLPSFQDAPAPPPVGSSSSSFAGNYASGGSFMVGGRSGVDKNPVAFNATRGEKVTIQTRKQQRAGQGGMWAVDNRVINFNVITSDADSFRRSKTQISRDFGEVINQ